ncbi:unnamed protein product [Rhizoctonia solani]|uniref:Uncharacterized protein n=1 Tax=Rhizoctonia solani TaxID=456999 RepID=A0A8H3DQM9_9AGAM|nr:unnamed protein product [Rhizoctonia solani]
MSADSLQAHPPITSKGLRSNKERYNIMRPGMVNPTLTDSNKRGSQVTVTYPRFYENPLKYTRKPSPPPKSRVNRIHSLTSPTRSTTPPTIGPSISSTSMDKENLAPGLEATNLSSHYATNSTNSWSNTKSPKKRSRGSLTLVFSNNASTDTKPPRSILKSSSAISSNGKRLYELTNTEYENTTTNDHRAEEIPTTRHAQGHKVPRRSRSVVRIPENVVTTQDFDCHRREVHTVVSTLGSRVSALENTIAAALPVVAEARLLWMENAIVRGPAKLGTTRHALCEYYQHPRYETYTRRIRARAYYFGLKLEDLEYLQERLDSLGSQSINQETLLISPFGGANEWGDKTMVEAYRRDTKHGAYARRIWRVCYESAYSVDEDWMLPVPTPDNLTLVEKIKGWFHE